MNKRIFVVFLMFLFAGSLVCLAATTVVKPTFIRVSVHTNGSEAVSLSGYSGSSSPSISEDGRFVAFSSWAPNLVNNDNNDSEDIFVHDVQTGKTERVSVNSDGDEPPQVDIFGWSSSKPSISSDGRYVAFRSLSDNLVDNDTNSSFDVFVRNRVNNTTQRVSVSSDEVQGNSGSTFPSISADGSCIAFESTSDNLISGDNNFATDIFVRDMTNGTTERVSVGPSGTEANGYSENPSISGDGRFVAFESDATNLDETVQDSGLDSDIFVHDRSTGDTEIISVSTQGNKANSWCSNPHISSDGRYVAFDSSASNLRQETVISQMMFLSGTGKTIQPN